MTVGVEEVSTTRRGSPAPLDDIVRGYDGLESVIVFQVGDASVQSAWVRQGAGYTPLEAATSLRDIYRACQSNTHKLDLIAPSTARRRDVEPPDPFVTLETFARVILLQRVRSFVIATMFDAALPLGMIRLSAARLVEVIRPSLPEKQSDGKSNRTTLRPSAPNEQAEAVTPVPPKPSPESEEEKEPPARTLAFPNTGSAAMRPSSPPPRATSGEVERTRKLLAYLDSHAPDPHVVRLRVSLRAGITPIALDHLESLGADAMVLVETAAEEILGIERAELRSLL